MLFKAAQPFLKIALRPAELRERQHARKWLQIATLAFAPVLAGSSLLLLQLPVPLLLVRLPSLPCRL